MNIYLCPECKNSPLEIDSLVPVLDLHPPIFTFAYFGCEHICRGFERELEKFVNEYCNPELYYCTDCKKMEVIRDPRRPPVPYGGFSFFCLNCHIEFDSAQDKLIGKNCCDKEMEEWPNSDRTELLCYECGKHSLV